MGQAGRPYSNWQTLILACAGCIIIVLAACSGTTEKPLTEEQATVDLELLLTLPANDISYQSQIRPILGRRCVVCHGCYDAPRQLKLSSPQGIERGANKDKVYHGSRILAAEPTRLFVDAKSTAEWRKKNFHAVLMEGEDYFLAFLPAANRTAIRDSWYQGIRADTPEEFDHPMDWLDVESVSGYQTDDPQRELYQLLEQRFRSVGQPEHDLDRCQADTCIEADNSDSRKRVDLAMQKIAHVSGSNLAVFPDIAFVRVRTGDDPLKDLAYTLIRNNAYTHVTSMFQDASVEANRDFEHDSLTVVDWLEGSYPNFFEHYLAIQTRDDYEQFVARYGVRRSNENFWLHADWFHDQYAREKPVLSGLFDPNRYRNR